MNWQDNIITIRQNIQKLESERLEKLEHLRLSEKTRAIALLKTYFLSFPDCKVWLFGSIIRPNSFSSVSDIDIAVKAYQGSRLDLYGDLEKLLLHKIDLVILEKSNISEEIMQHGEQII